jgi:MFS family permease
VTSRLLAEPLEAFAAIARNRSMRNLQLAGVGSTLGIWAYGVGIAVFAYRSDGATAVGLLYFVRWSFAGAAAPWLALLADRLPRRRVMLASDLVRAALVGAMAAAAGLGTSPYVVYVLAVAASVAGAAFQPAQAALLPSLARTPEELTSANVALSTTSSAGMFAGPALAGALLAVGDPWLVLALTAGTFVWSALCLRGIPADVRPEPAGPAETVGPALLAGFRAILGDSRLRLLVGLTGARMLVAGAFEVLIVVVALSLLRAGNGGVGWLNTALGVGSLLGAVGASALAGKRRLARDLGLGLVLFGLPIALTATSPGTAVVLVLFLVAGAGTTLAEVAGITLLQRTSSDELLGRVFGVLESLIFAALAVGAAVTPGIVDAFGARATLVAAGVLLPALFVLLWPSLRAIDAAATVPEEALALLRALPIFAPLPGPALEQLASGAQALEAAPGAVVVEQGAAGDRFYVVAAGRAVAEADGATLRELGPGDFFGEIALLRDVPRTATVRAVEPLRLLIVERDAFLAAVTGHAPSRAAANRIVSERLPATAPV